jgi:hypothetical protein
MHKYTIQAQLGNQYGAVIFSAYDDDSATIRAVEIILEHATWSNTWSKGSITLRDPSGTLLRTMDAKAIGDHACYPLVEGDQTCFTCNSPLPIFSKVFHRITGL